MSLLEIRGPDRRTDLLPVGQTAMGAARHPGVLGCMSPPEIRGLDRRKAQMDHAGIAEGA